MMMMKMKKKNQLLFKNIIKTAPRFEKEIFSPYSGEKTIKKKSHGNSLFGGEGGKGKLESYDREIKCTSIFH